MLRWAFKKSNKLHKNNYMESVTEIVLNFSNVVKKEENNLDIFEEIV